MSSETIPTSTQNTASFDEALELITLLRGSMTRRQLAESLQVSTSTVERWESGKVKCKPAIIPALREWRILVVVATPGVFGVVVLVF